MSDLRLGTFEIYVLARDFSRKIWKVFCGLPAPVRFKTGWQLVESADSVQANIAEGFGRFHFKDKRNFEFHARGSLLEALSWCEILHERGFIDQVELQEIQELGNLLSVKLNNHIAYLTRQSSPNNT